MKPFEIQLQELKTDFTGERCWVHARGAISPGGRAIITTQPLRLSGSDIFYGLSMLSSSDGGNSWSAPVPTGLDRRQESDGCEIAFCDATPFWHRATQRFLLTGQTALYHNDEMYPDPRPRSTAWSVLDPASDTWSPFRLLEMPGHERYFSCGAGCTQILELPGGELLIPVYFMSKDEAREPWLNSFHAAVLRCSFDGNALRCLEIGDALTWDTPRGLYEPSIARIGNRFYLTLRNDETGFAAESSDGLHFGQPREWCFDDGISLGNDCTQQHWITAGERLYLVYTRRGANNDHIFRHRAPLFIAEVDHATLRVIRSTESVAVPERGARLGNFGTVHVSENESWVIASEWMQTTGPDPGDFRRCMSYGSCNAIFVAKIRFR